MAASKEHLPPGGTCCPIPQQTAEWGPGPSDFFLEWKSCYRKAKLKWNPSWSTRNQDGENQLCSARDLPLDAFIPMDVSPSRPTSLWATVLQAWLIFFFPSGFLWIIPGLKNERCWGFTNCIHGHPGSLMILTKVYKDEFVYSFRCLIMKKCYVALSAVWRPSCLPYLYFIFVNCRLNLWISGSIRIKTLELLPISGRILKPEFPHHNMAIIVIFQNNSFLGPGNKTYNIKWFCRIWNVINKEVLF